MNYKLIGGILAAIGSLAGIGSFFLNASRKHEQITIQPPAASSNAVTQTSSGSFSPNVANVQGNVTVNVNGGKTKLDIPSFDFSLEPFSGWRRDSLLGEKFNNTMVEYLDKTVYLSITLAQGMFTPADQKRDEYGRLIFTVPDNYDKRDEGGNEYLIHLSPQDPSPFEFRDNVAVLSGYFKVYDINGPRQGYMSVNLRPVRVN